MTSVCVLLQQKLTVSHTNVHQYCIGDGKCMYVTKWLCISIVCTYTVQIEHGRTIIGIIAIFIQCQLSLYFRFSSVSINISTVYVKSLITWFTLYFSFPCNRVSTCHILFSVTGNIWHRTQNQYKQNKTNTTKNIKKISNTDLTEAHVLSMSKQYRFL